MTTDFQAAFKLSPHLNDWCNYFFVGVPLDGDPLALEDAFRYIPTSDLRARIDGWSCRQIVEFCNDRWESIVQAANPQERNRRTLDSTKAVIHRIQLTWRDIHEIESLLHTHQHVLDYHLRFEMLLTSIRLWRYQELCIHRSELHMLWNYSIAEVLELYTTGGLGFQTCWSGTLSVRALIKSAWDGGVAISADEGSDDGEEVGSDQDDPSNGEGSEESEW
jgi:hypothetical protein